MSQQKLESFHPRLIIVEHFDKLINRIEKYKEKWSHVIDDNTLEYEHKIYRIKEELILFDWKLNI